MRRALGSLRSSFLSSLFGATLLLAPLALATSTGCDLFGEPKPDVANKQTFSGEGLHFDYPGNWESQVERETVEGGVTLTSIFVQAKRGNAMAIVQQFSPAVPVDYDMLVAEFVKGVQEGMPGFASAKQLDGGQWPAINRTLVGADRPGRQVHYAAEVLGESVPHTVEIFFVELEDRTVVVYTQVPDEDRGKAVPGFDLLLDSLAMD